MFPSRAGPAAADSYPRTLRPQLGLARKFRFAVASSLLVVKNFVIKSGRRAVTVRSAGTAQQALLDYLRALGCRDSEIVRLGNSTIAWRGARYSAAPAPERES